MKIRIGDVEYPFVHPAQASNTTLITLYRQSALTFDLIMEGLEKLGKGEKDEDPVAYATRVLSDIEILLTIGALVFIAKWAAGERPSFEEANDISFAAVSFIGEPGDAQAVDDQGEALTLPASVPGGNRVARRATSTRSRSATSKRPSLGT